MRDTYADTSRAQADLGFAPSVTLEEGLRAMCALDGSDIGNEWTSMNTDCGRWLVADGHRRGVRAKDRQRCRRAPRRPTSSCSSAAGSGRKSASGSTRASTSATSSTTIRRARFARTRSWRSATPTSARTPPSRCCSRANEFREFLTFYPTHPRADYAQLQLARSLRRADAGARARSVARRATRSRKSRCSCSGIRTAR